MKIGMPALVEYTSLEELVELCLELKLDFIELNMNMPYNFIENIDPQLLRKITEDTNIEFTMHMPDEADLGTFYPSVREGFVKLFADTIRWAGESGVKVLNLHVIEGAKMTLPHKKVYIYDQYSDEFMDNFIKSIASLSPIAQEKDVTLSIENSHNFGQKYIQRMLDKAVTYPNIELTWDTGHDAVSNFTDKEYLFKQEEHICHMHFHDAKGSSDHQVPFDGDLNISEIVTFARKRDIRMLIEVKTAQAVRQSVEVLRAKKLI
jgi:sugar phosphate isomerase/epimerase